MAIDKHVYYTIDDMRFFARDPLLDLVLQLLLDIFCYTSCSKHIRYFNRLDDCLWHFRRVFDVKENIIYIMNKSMWLSRSFKCAEC